MAVKALLLHATTVCGEQDHLRRRGRRRWSFPYAAHRRAPGLEDGGCWQAPELHLTSRRGTVASGPGVAPGCKPRGMAMKLDAVGCNADDQKPSQLYVRA